MKKLNLFKKIIIFFIAKPLFNISKFLLLITGVRKGIELTEIEAIFKERLGAGSSDVLEKQKSKMVESIYRLGNMMVREVMVPRIDIVAVKENDSIERTVRLAEEQGKTRIPVYRDSIDNITGILHAKDLLGVVSGRKGKDVDISDIMRKPYFVPETKNVYELLEELRSQRVHLAIVIDEYGGTSGLVTLEDLIEEIIGEVRDEYDKEEKENIKPSNDGGFEIDARTSLEDVNRTLKVSLISSEDYDTVGGFICAYLGRIPKTKESFEYEDLKIIILEAGETSIDKIKVYKKTKS